MESQTSPPPLPATAICSNCGKTVPRSDVITLQNATVCAACKPIVVQRMKEGSTINRGGVWRENELLVAEKGSVLPDRCVKCNGPAEGFRLQRKLTWHPSGYYFLIIFPGLLIYALVAMCISKRATLHVGLCSDHRRKRTNGMLVAWGLFAASLASFFAAAAFRSGWLVVIGFLLLLASPIYGSITCRTISPKRIDETHAWVNGACPEYLNSL